MINMTDESTKVQKRKKANHPKEEKNNEIKESSNLRYGPLPKISSQRIWSRGIVILGVLLYVWYTSGDGKELVLAKQKNVISLRGQNVECDVEYLNEIKQFPECVPNKCGRYVSDKIITITEAETLLNVAKKGISLGGSSGGASILDLHSGALSHEDKFVNIYNLERADKFITPTDLAIYKIVKNKIQNAIADNFKINRDSLYLTHPTFFSKLSNAEPKTQHDEYWHIHVDKETYESFHYTSLVYLTDYNVDFKGGRIIFVDSVDNPSKNVTLEPRKGRVLMFSSGAENPHFVEKVITGCDNDTKVSNKLCVITRTYLHMEEKYNM